MINTLDKAAETGAARRTVKGSKNGIRYIVRVLVQRLVRGL